MTVYAGLTTIAYIHCFKSVTFWYNQKPKLSTVAHVSNSSEIVDPDPYGNSEVTDPEPGGR
jgi:hypothetical protein